MKARLEDKQLAIKLRKQGLSYKEIQQRILVSKGLLSRWLMYLSLSSNEEKLLKTRIADNQDRGRLRASFSNITRRMEREAISNKDAELLFSKHLADPTFIIGIALYWAEGTKRSGSFSFINSDPDMVVFMHKWIKKFMPDVAGRVTYRLFIHRILGYEGAEEFWSKKLGIEPHNLQKTIYKPTIHAIKKNPDYHGCFRMDINRIHSLRMMKAWQKLLIAYYGERM